MNKKVLVLYYTQSGQLTEIINSFTVPFKQGGISLEIVRVKTQPDFEFPWTSERFFDAMPESVLGIPLPLQPFEIKETRYDLVIVAYQPWYLSPSIPATSIMMDAQVKNVLKNSPVITLIAARNMWLNAQEKMKQLLKLNGARLVANIVLVDRHRNLPSAISILHWMLSGKRDSYLGFFPKPGISDKDIENAKGFGQTACNYLLKGNWDGLQQTLVGQKALEVNSDLLFIEERAGRLFTIWAKLVTKGKNRAAWLRLFKYYLFIALFLVAPLVLTINFLFFRPFLLRSIKQKKQYYLGLS